MKYFISLLALFAFTANISFAQLEIFEAKATKAFDAKDYQTAADYSSKIIAQDSLNYKARLNRGSSFFYLCNNDSALIDLNIALSIKPDKENVLQFRGMTFMNMKRYQEAINDFDKCIELNPKNHDAFTYKGNAYFMTSRFGEAIECFNQSIKIDPKQSIAYFQRGSAYSKQGKFKEALKEYNQAEKNGYSSNKLYFSRANSYFQLGKFNDAITNYSQAISQDSNDVEAYNNRAICYNRIGDTASARADKRMKFMLMKQGFIPSLDNINFIRYSDDSSHFSFELPDNWTRVSKNDSTSNIVCIALEKITSVEDYCKVSVTAGFETHFSEKYGAKTPSEILEFWKSSGTENAKDYARYELLSTKMKKYQGRESVLNEILVQIDKNSQLLCFQEFILPFDDAVLYILFQSPFEDSPYFKKIYENSIRSLKFTPPSTSN